ncbi:MAG: histidine phosphatase family protein, partial [Lachnospiraceae bacterium]|nr:histidine phosphatase family protein [Lachnospiraceae bacterium]
VVQDFRECDFGVFEGKNYAELNGDTAYQRWIDSAGMTPPPNGEGKADFARRCCGSFWKVMEGCEEKERIAVVVHGGTVMALLEAFGVPKRGFYDYQLENGGVYIAECDRKKRELHRV